MLQSFFISFKLQILFYHSNWIFFYSELLPAKYVRVGDIDISTDKDDANAIQLLVVQLIQHPDYDRYTKYNDIALLRLEKKIAFNGFVRPACLADSFESTLDSKIIATGWGHTKWTGEGSSVLQKVSLDLFNHTICSYIYSNNLMISNETQICAGSFTSSNDTCTVIETGFNSFYLFRFV